MASLSVPELAKRNNFGVFVARIRNGKEFKLDNSTGQTIKLNKSLLTNLKSISNVLDTLYQNPDWKAFLPTNFNLELAVNKEYVKQIPLALASAVLSPKVLFPILILMQVVESQAKNTYNQAVTSGNTVIQSGNTTLGNVNNIINNGVDFLKVFKGSKQSLQ